jgi:hypothetical protein
MAYLRDCHSFLAVIAMGDFLKQPLDSLIHLVCNGVEVPIDILVIAWNCWVVRLDPGVDDVIYLAIDGSSVEIFKGL